MRFEAFMTLKVYIVVWFMTLCNLMGAYQRFGGTCCVHLQGLCHKDGGSTLFQNPSVTSQLYVAMLQMTAL
jgi:hypothetical protein